MTGYDEERIAVLLRLLPAPPQGWVEAAQQLPLARAAIDSIVARAKADAAFRARLVADLESAVQEAGFEPTPSVLASLRL
ncbi:MAG TPA: Os1348 family NHLP clan protein, partial [Gaiellaceae bacterium]